MSEDDIRFAVAGLLGVDADAVDPAGDLIAQGLDSIRMMSLAGQWRRQGHDIAFAGLAAEPSVRAWAALLSGPVAAPETSGPAVASDDEDQPFGLAPMQHAMWIGRQDDQQLGGVSGHLYVEFDSNGSRDAVDLDELRRAATELAARHPMLRVRFQPDGTQRIGAAPAQYPILVEDLRALSADDAAARLLDIRHRRSHQQLTGEVLQLGLTLLPSGRTRLHIDLDMQAADAMSYRTLTDDLAALYQGEQLPALGYTYRQYRQTVTGRPESAEYGADRQWWTDRLDDMPDPPTLPVVPQAEQADPRRSERRWHWFDPQAKAALYRRAQAHSVTPAMVFGASFADAVAGWSTNQRFLLNVPLFSREQIHPEVEKLVGDFTSSVLVDVDLADAQTPAQRSHTLQESVHAAAAHAAYPGLSVLRDLGRRRGSQLIAPVVFTSALGLGELFSSRVTTTFGSPVWIISQGPQVLLDAQVTELDGGVLVNWDVREDAFRPGVVDAMFARHIEELQAMAAADAAWETTRPPLVTPAQRAVRDGLNVTAARSAQALHDGFFATAAAHPDAPAVISSTGTTTYAELARHVLAVAAALGETGLKPGGTIAVLGPKSADQIPALLGILAAGGVYLPVGVDVPVERARRILAGAGVDAALVCGADASTVAELSLDIPVLSVAQAVSSAPATAAAVTDPNELAYVLFTSGSTGEPKGVEVTHAAAMNTVEFINEHFGIGPADRCLALSTLECDLSVLDVFGTLRSGGAIVVVDECDRRSPEKWAQLIAEHGVTVAHFLPGWLEMLVQTAQSGQLRTLRVAPTGGDWVRPAMVHRLRELAPDVRVAGLGGATETAVHNTIHEVSALPGHWSAVPMGSPLPNNVCRVIDAHGGDCPDWVSGEFWVAGRGIARGYRGRPDLTAQKFVEHDGRTWYRTGDLARYWPDGTLEFVGRADDRVKISGYRVELGDVEAALQRIPGVTAAVAAVVPPGAAKQQLVAAVVLDDPGLTESAIRQALAAQVPAHMVPARIQAVGAVPRTPGGKIDRARVARELTVVESGYREPRTPLARAIAIVMGDLVGVDRVSADGDFFTLGGDSVLATTVVARIRDWLDCSHAAVADVFATRTPESLAAVLQARETDDGRLNQVAELFLEVLAMDAADVEIALSGQVT